MNAGGPSSPDGPTEPSAVEIPGSSPRRKHLPFLDGIRGVAALYVVVCHADLICIEAAPPVRRVVHLLTQWAAYGQIAVSVFIVLSGYCLTLPLVGTGRRLGLTSFFFRRARRILPAYYAALGLCVLAIGVGWLKGTGYRLDATGVIGHALLVHNFDPPSAHAIDSPMWSVATEWQIYFLFPPLVWLWRRSGIVAVVVSTLVFSAVVAVVSSDGLNDSVRPWYLSLFAFGIAAAVFTEMPTTRSRSADHAAISAALTASALLPVYVFKTHFGRYLFFVTDVFEGLAAALLIIHCRRTPGSWLTRLFSSPIAVRLGFVSYSLYLVHYPVLSWLNQFWIDRNWHVDRRLFGMLTLGTAACLVVVMPFHLMFERPFLALRRRKIETAI